MKEGRLPRALSRRVGEGGLLELVLGGGGGVGCRVLPSAVSPFSPPTRHGSGTLWKTAGHCWASTDSQVDASEVSPAAMASTVVTASCSVETA